MQGRYSPVAGRRAVMAILAVVAAVLLAGCDDHITVLRNPEVPIHKQMTWAWQPERPPTRTRSDRPVISRDVIEPAEVDVHGALVRDILKNAIENTLDRKGLVEVSDPKAADFLVAYHVGVQRKNVTLRTVEPYRYPTVVCGYWRCWNSWDWGYWGPPEVRYRNYRFSVGTLVVDLVRRDDHKPAFRAIGQKQVMPDSFTQRHIDDSVRHLLKDLKPA